MALIPQPILDYSTKDYAALRLRLRKLARSVWPQWTDYNAPNWGNLMLELFAHVGDQLTFYQDAQARECFWPTLTRRISAIRQGRLINFTMPGATPASGKVRFSLPQPAAVTVSIPLGTRLRSVDPLDPLPFQTTAAATIPVGQTFVDVDVEQTENITNEIFESTGAVNQEFILARVPYVEGSARVVAADGEYTSVTSFLDVTAADPRRFVALVDQIDRAHLRFGNGVMGKIPEGSITVSYKITRGGTGNLDINMVRIILDPIYDVANSVVNNVTVTNITKTSGGGDRMSVAQARSLAPASLRALTRSVTRPDFETHAMEVSGVARAIFLTSNEDPGVAENSGLLLVVARGERLASGKYSGATAEAGLLALVEHKVKVEKPPTATFLVTVQSAPFKDVDIAVRVHFVKGANKESTASDILANLKDLFAASEADGTANAGIDFGANVLKDDGTAASEIAWGDVYDVIHDTDGVRKIDENNDNLTLNTTRQSLAIGLREFPRLRKLTVVDASNSATVLSWMLT